MEKQRAIFLIVDGFNFGNKLYFSYRILKQPTGHVLVPPEQHELRYHNFL